MIDWETFFTVLAALIVFDVIKGLPAFCRGVVDGYRKARRP